VLCTSTFLPINFAVRRGPDLPAETVTDDQREGTDGTSPVVARGRALLAALGVREAPAALAALAHATFEAAAAVDLPALDAADELVWLQEDPRVGAAASARALELCEATPALARRLPGNAAARAQAARFELEETLDAIARRVLFERFER
jgi:hypothetical protein